MYRLIYSLSTKNIFNSKWILLVKSILNNSGFSHVWTKQDAGSGNTPSFKHTLSQRLKDQFIQSWLSDINNSSTCSNYRIFKTNHGFENYLINLPIVKAINLCKYRTSCTKIPIVTGRYNNIDRDNRICTLCNNDIGDEFHYIFICNHFNQLRTKYVRPYYTKGANALKMEQLFTTSKIEEMKNLANFINYIIDSFK